MCLKFELYSFKFEFECKAAVLFSLRPLLVRGRVSPWWSRTFRPWSSRTRPKCPSRCFRNEWWRHRTWWWILDSWPSGRRSPQARTGRWWSRISARWVPTGRGPLWSPSVDRRFRRWCSQWRGTSRWMLLDACKMYNIRKYLFLKRK